MNDHDVKPSSTRRCWPESIPDIVWAPLASGILLLIVGIFAFAVNQPLLFPSLGPTAYLQAENPEHPSSRFYNVVAGHLLGLASGFLVVALLGVWYTSTPPATEHINVVHVLAAVLALALTVFTGLILHASHAPAAATTLLVALGIISTSQEALHLVIGVIIIATFGEAVRRIRLGEISQWPR